jgi:hypothetical protein
VLFCHASALLRKVKVIDGFLGIRLSRSSSILPTAVSRRRWLFIGHSLAGWRSATMFTVLLSCRRQGINPQHYLTDVLDPLPLFNTLLASKLATAPDRGYEGVPSSPMLRVLATPPTSCNLSAPAAQHCYK